MESQIIKSLGSRIKFLGSGISKMLIRINIREHPKWKSRMNNTEKMEA
jgi:hypothetical protein